MKFILYIIPFILLCISNTQAQSISSTGNWTVNIPDNYKVKEAGMDYANGVSIESSPNQTLINSHHHNIFWRITVSSNSIPENMLLSCKRTGDGIPQPWATIYSGEDYINISNTPQVFFIGTLDYDNIPIQYKLYLSNLSVTTPVKTYTINITYTIIRGW